MCSTLIANAVSTISVAMAAAAAEQAANPPSNPSDDAEPERHSKFHNFMFGNHMGREI